MDPTLVTIPRRVRLRRGRFAAPLPVGWILQLMMLAALYDVLRPLWCMFCFITKGHSLDTVPMAIWNTWLGLPPPKTPVSALIQIVVAGVLLFVFRALAEVLVWRGQREKDLLVKGRAMSAKVIKARSDGGKHYVTYSQMRDGLNVEHEVECKSPHAVGSEVIVIFTFDYQMEMLYEQCRYEVAS